MERKKPITKKQKRHDRNKHRETLRQRAKRVRKQREEQRLQDEFNRTPIYIFPDVHPLIYRMHKLMHDPSPYKIAVTCYLCWGVFAGITSDRDNVQLFIPLLNADPDLGILSHQVYEEERRHRFDYMKPQELPCAKFTKDIVDLVIKDADAKSDDELLAFARQDPAYRYAISHNQKYVEPYIVIDTYTKWVNALTNNGKSNSQHK